jgi:hypothetical protein
VGGLGKGRWGAATGRTASGLRSTAKPGRVPEPGPAQPISLNHDVIKSRRRCIFDPQPWAALYHISMTPYMAMYVQHLLQNERTLDCLTRRKIILGGKARPIRHVTPAEGRANVETVLRPSQWSGERERVQVVHRVVQ